MALCDPGGFYVGVPEAQVQELLVFRASHPWKKTTIAGREWSYLSCGQGDESLLLFPGDCGGPEALFRLIRALEGDYRIISPRCPPLDSMAGIVEGARRLLEQEGISRTHVYGASFGGFAAQCFIHQHPGLTDRVVLSNTTVPGGAHGKRAARQARLLPLLSLLPARTLTRSAYHKNRKLLDVPAAERQFWDAWLEETFTARYTRADALTSVAAVRDFVRQYRFRPETETGWQGRMLLIESGLDKAFDPAAKAALKATYPSAAVYTFKEAGHTPMLREPDRYAAVVRRFLADGTTGARLI